MKVTIVMGKAVMVVVVVVVLVVLVVVVLFRGPDRHRALHPLHPVPLHDR
jgi:hypothetical protein